MTIALISNGDMGGVARTKINAAIGQINNRTALNIRDYGATGNGVTDDSAALAAAIAASNAVQWTGVVPPLIYAPAGAYKIMATQIPPFGLAPNYGSGGGIIGDGTNKTMFVIDKSYSGDVFSWAEAWWATFFNNTDKFTGNVTDMMGGPIAKDFSIFGDQTGTNLQVALGLYDRCDNVYMSNINIHYMKRGLYIGAPKIQVASYNRESYYESIKFWECGTATLPAMELTSTGTDDRTNTNMFVNINIFAPKSVGLWMRGNKPSCVGGMIFNGLRVESVASGNRLGDMVMIGDPTMTGYCRDIYISNFQGIIGNVNYALLRMTADTLANHSYLVSVDGSLSGPGKGIVIDYGRSISLNIHNVATAQANIELGPNHGAPIHLNGFGNEPFWTQTLPATPGQRGALRYPVYGLLEATVTYDPPSIASPAMTTTSVNVPGCKLGDFALASFSNPLAGMALTAYCTTDVVTCVFTNNTGTPVDLASGTLRVKVVKSVT